MIYNCYRVLLLCNTEKCHSKQTERIHLGHYCHNILIMSVSLSAAISLQSNIKFFAGVKVSYAH